MPRQYGRRVRPRLADTGAKVYNFLGLVYVEDLEKNGATVGDFLAYCANLQMKIGVSPVHDKDVFDADDVWRWCERHVDPETGDLDCKYLDNAPYVGKPKKEHLHFILKGNRQRTAQEASELFEGLMEIRPTIWEKCEDIEASTRYFVHMYNPEKAQYARSDCHAFGGFNLDPLMSSVQSKVTKTYTVNEIMSIIDANDIKYFTELNKLIRATGDIDMMHVLFGRASLFNIELRSRRTKRNDIAMAKRLEAEARAKEAEESDDYADAEK